MYLRHLLPDGAPYMLRGGLSGNPVVKTVAVLATLRWACCSLAGGGAGGPSYPVVIWRVVHPAFLVEVGMLQQDLVTSSSGWQGEAADVFCFAGL